MRNGLALIATIVLTSSVGFSDVTYNLYLNGTSDTSATILPGNSLQLAVEISTTAGEAIAGARYDVQLPLEGWTLSSRDYGSYGWAAEDGLHDGSIPVPSACPVVIDIGTYTGGDADTADFLFNAAQVPYPGTVGSGATVEVFTLTIPADTLLDISTINLANTYAYDLLGAEIASSGSSFDLDVTPEPGSALLLLVGLGGLGAALRRRRSG